MEHAILAATCDCPIGLAEHCSHIGAMLFLLEDCKWSGSTSRTSKSSQWNVPRAMKLQPEQLNDIEVTCPKYRKVGKDTESNPATKNFDPRAPAHRDQLDEHYMTAVQELVGACGELAIGHLWGIHPQPPDAALEITVSTSTAADDMHPLIIEAGHTPPDIIMKPITAEVQEKVFNGTKGQSSNPMWQQLRKGRLTSSLFGDIIKCHNMPSKTLMKRIMGNSKSYGQAIEWGKEHEAHALAEYQELLGVKVDTCGLCLHNTYPFLGTSPDGITKDAVVEVKCPYTGRDKTVNELVESGYPHIHINDDGSLELRKTSIYYYQVTGQMALMGCNMCHLIVWTPHDMEIISVPFDHQLWKEEIMPKLVSFYETFILPEIVLPKFK